ncbi:MAG TPA: sigma-54-dependent Fis family transcriptional regulator [Planctomycetes bacterium]|nr:sigma-54-dependent Fis family transcriptional regulator [Planctomycetota bacterium]
MGDSEENKVDTAGAGHPAASVLIVDDDRDFRQLARKCLEERNYSVSTATTGEDALKLLDQRRVDVVLLDYRLPGQNGMEVLECLKALYPGVDVVMLTSHGSIPLAVEAMKRGAADYITKPFIADEVAKILEMLVERRRLLAENVRLRRMLNEQWSVEAFKGHSDAARQLREQIRLLAQSSATALITGESGTGKELVARALHTAGPRAGGPFVAVNSAGLPSGLAESELFGHRKGAFTGAAADSDGLFASADGGTIFLDEIADMPLELQPKLLRAIETLEIRPVGSDTSRRVNVRIIAATNRDLEAEVAAGRFRQDLFYRLNVVRIHVPPLRERAEDVLELAEHFLASRRDEKLIRGFTPEAVAALEAYAWPGNARELENAVERAAALSTGTIIDIPDLPRQLAELHRLPAAAPADPASRTDTAAGAPLLTLKETERITVMRSMALTGGDKSRAARILGINRATLYRKLREYKLIPETPAQVEKKAPPRKNRKKSGGLSP